MPSTNEKYIQMDMNTRVLSHASIYTQKVRKSEMHFAYRIVKMKICRQQLRYSFPILLKTCNEKKLIRLIKLVKLSECSDELPELFRRETRGR